jgi:transposase
MPKPLQLELTVEEREALQRIRDRDPRAYMRERAAALLKVADGASGRSVALRGLLQVRDPDSVYTWFHRFKAAGIAGLRIRKGRGRKPAFSP